MPDTDYLWLRKKSRPKLAKSPEKTIRMMDLFSGCGGITVGIDAACVEMNTRLETVLAWDIFTEATDVYERNFPETIIRNDDISDIINGARGEPHTKEETAFLAEIGEINLIVGGPPCQGNSNLNNHTRGTDERNLLYLRMARVIEITQPEYAIIENVAGVRRAAQNVVSETNTWLRSMGYCVVEGLVDGEKIGVPQTRKRHFTIASKQNKHLKLENFQTSEHEENPRPISWAIQDLVDKKYPSSDIFNTASNANAVNKARMQYLHDNNIHNLPSSERPKCHQKYSEHGPTGNTYPAMYGRMYWDKPSPTITTGYSCNGRGRFVHPKKPRCLTPHEAARVQTFPDYFKFNCNNRTKINRMLGNAVPPLMAKHIGINLLEE